jgi:hypothetical protein
VASKRQQRDHESQPLAPEAAAASAGNTQGSGESLPPALVVAARRRRRRQARRLRAVPLAMGIEPALTFRP